MKQKEVVLEYIDRFGSITSFDAFTDLGITRLSSVIHDLRGDGIAITSTTEETKNRYGKMVRYARYSRETES